MAKEAKKNSKDKKKFGKDFKAELKRVVWPTPKELTKSTIAVITIVIVIVAIVFCLDFVFESMNKYGIDRIKEAVSSEETTKSEENTETEEQENSSDTEQTEGEEEATETVEETVEE